MNSKNIKRSLIAKLKDWTASVEDEAVKTVIRKSTIVTGGALVSMLNGEEVNDYDVYFRTKEAALTVANYYVARFNAAHGTQASVQEKDGRISAYIKSKGVIAESKEVSTVPDETEPAVSEEAEPAEAAPKAKYRPVYITSNAITLSNKIQLVIRFFGEVEDIHKNYDFAHCTCAWSSWDNALSLPAEALECIINKELRYMGSLYPLCSIIRSRKFIKRGYTINAGQYLKMALQLNELDLKDINVLRDQLIGVDSAYFDMLIEAVAAKKEKNPEWQIENNYLFELINRIF